MISQSTPPQLGFGRPAMAQLCVRNWEFFVSLSAELGEHTEDTIYDAELSAVSDWPRIERQHMEDAALELLSAVQTLPPPVRDVVVRRSRGWSWTAISAGLPGRAYFSLTDDWAAAVRLVWSSHGDLVRRLI
jgi:hypothetical protein